MAEVDSIRSQILDFMTSDELSSVYMSYSAGMRQPQEVFTTDDVVPFSARGEAQMSVRAGSVRNRVNLDSILLDDSTTTEPPQIDDILKQRHLTQDERRLYHKPKSDWREGGKGEECRSASTLDCSDLIISK
jgi:hypothetical protein